MPKATFIDTSLVVALINERDQFHSRATELADLLAGNPLLTTDAVLMEIGNALARKFKAQATEVIEQFLNSDDVTIVRLTSLLFEESFALYKAHADKQWGLTDCISFVVMRQASVQDAITFDQHFSQAGFNALMRP